MPKICRTCQRSLPSECFYKRAGSADGLNTQCRACRIASVGRWQRKNKTQANRNKVRWAKRNPDKAREARLRCDYRISLEWYDFLFNWQDGVCAICRLPERALDHTSQRPRWLAVDHDHACCPGQRSCGKCVRGLLCYTCNTLLGASKDSVGNLERAKSYLTERRSYVRA